MSQLAVPAFAAPEPLPHVTPRCPARLLRPHELERLVVSVGRRPELWRSSVDANPDAPFVTLRADEHMELLLFRWADGQATDVHGHDRSSGAFYLCDGSVVEDRFGLRRSVGKGSLLAHTGRRTLRAGAAVSFAPPYFHAVRHLAGTPPAYSIHAYSPPFERRTSG